MNIKFLKIFEFPIFFLPVQKREYLSIYLIFYRVFYDIACVTVI